MLAAILTSAALFAFYAVLRARTGKCEHNCGMCERTCGTSETHHD